MFARRHPYPRSITRSPQANARPCGWNFIRDYVVNKVSRANHSDEMGKKKKVERSVMDARPRRCKTPVSGRRKVTPSVGRSLELLRHSAHLSKTPELLCVRPRVRRDGDWLASSTRRGLIGNLLVRVHACADKMCTTFQECQKALTPG